jgi:hypothetical protein
MTTRSTIVHTVSTTQPPSAGIGDEWYNPTTNTLYKNVSVNATSPQWVEFFSTTPTGSSATFGNVTVNGALTVGAGGSLNVSNFTQTINISMPGTITAPVTGTALFYPTRSMTLTIVNANLGVAPGGSFIFQILKNGVSIGYNFTITAQNPLMTPIYLTGAGITLTVTDHLSINILNGSALGQDLAVKISYV